MQKYTQPPRYNAISTLTPYIKTPSQFKWMKKKDECWNSLDTEASEARRWTLSQILQYYPCFFLQKYKHFFPASIYLVFIARYIDFL